MKFDHASQRATLRIALCGILFFFLLWNISVVWKTALWLVGVLSPVIIGLCFAFVINPLVSGFERLFFKLRKKSVTKRTGKLFRALAILLSFIVVFGVLTILILIILPEVSATFVGFAAQLPRMSDQILGWLRALPFDSSMLEELFQQQPDWDKVIATVTGFFKNGAGTDLVSGVLGATVSLLGGLWDLIFGLIISIYVLSQKEAIGSFFSRFIRAFLPRRSERIFHVSRLADDAFTSFVMGQLIEALIIGVLCYIGMDLLRFPFALTIATIVAMSALIPVFGAWIGAILGALLILTVSPMQALWFLIFLVVLQQLEGNLIYPRVVGKSVGLPALIVMLAVWIGGSLSGVVGMLFAVPLSSVLYTLIKEAMNARLGPEPVGAAKEPAPEKIPEKPPESGAPDTQTP